MNIIGRKAELREKMRIYTMAEVADLLKVDAQTVRRLVKCYEIESFRVGSQYRITETAITNFISENSLENEASKGESK